MKWLSWSLVDPYKEIGGSEIHSLCVGHYLTKKFNVIFKATNELPELWSDDYDIIQTHGSALPKKFLRKRLWKKIYSALTKSPRPYYIHTVHGENIAIMRALGKMHKIGFWKAYLRELRGCLLADLVASVHPDLGLLKIANFFNRAIVVHGNAWNSCEILHEALNYSATKDAAPLPNACNPLFVGRINDPAKGFARIKDLFYQDRSRPLTLIPGEKSTPSNVCSAGKLTPQEIVPFYQNSSCLIVPSKWESGPLVALEALAQGCPVVMDRVGVLPTYKKLPIGIQFVENPLDIDSWQKAILLAEQNFPSSSRGSRANLNKKLIPNWEECTSLLVKAVVESRPS